jgi:tripartite-type tricarboxylate transporter receptor subunit TctC
MQTVRVLASALLLALGVVSTAAAQPAAWPTKPIRLVVGFPPGSSPDVIARALSPGLSAALGQPIVVENRSGVTGMLAADVVAKSPPDGHTLLLTSGSAMSITVHTQDKLPLDPVRELAPVAATARVELFLVANTNQPFKTYPELVKYAKSHPGKLSYATPGNGSAPHVAAEMFKAQAGITAVHIPYRGSSPALQDLLGGQVHFIFDPGVALEHVRAGKLNLLAVASSRRSALFPQTPTLQELGLAGFDAGTTHAVYAPVQTPRAVVIRLNEEINKLLATPQVAQQIRGFGAEPSPMSPEELGAQIARDSARYGAIVKARGIRE